MRDDLYEGKAKQVRLLPNGLAEIYFKDDATAGNGKKRASFPGKGALCCRISELLLSYLARCQIRTHLVARQDDRTLLCRAVQIIPLEVVVRFEVAPMAGCGLPMRSRRIPVAFAMCTAGRCSTKMCSAKTWPS